MKPAGSTEVIHGAIAITIPAAPASRDAAKAAVQEAEEEAEMDIKDAAMEAVVTEAVAEMEMAIIISTKRHKQLQSRDSSSQKRMPREPRGTRQSSIISTL
jgi:lactate dehydrogenase-like 2-hydroxyacid dehydrogenase